MTGTVPRGRGPFIASVAAPGALLGLTYLGLVVLPAGRALDQAGFAGRLDGGRHLLGFSRLLLGSITAPSVVAVLAALAIWATLTGRTRRGLVAVGSVVAAAGSAELMKLVLPGTAADGVARAAGSFPSGHVTLAAALALAVMSLLDGRGRRRLAGPAAAWVVSVAAATVTAGWHRPSDALGGVLLAVTWSRIGAFARTRGGGDERPREAAHSPRQRSLMPVSVYGWCSLVAVPVLLSVVVPSARGESPGEPGVLSHVVSLTLLMLACSAAMVWSMPWAAGAAVVAAPRSPGARPTSTRAVGGSARARPAAPSPGRAPAPPARMTA